MIKRLRWLVLGAIFGVVAYQWATRRAREALPSAGRDLARSATDGMRELGARVREAIAAGADAMREREDELRGELLRE
jgi:hypothetical protein